MAVGSFYMPTLSNQRSSSRRGTASQPLFWPRLATGWRLNGHFGFIPPRDGVFPLLRPFVLGFCLQSLRDKRDKLEEEAYRRDKSRAHLVDDAAWDEKVQEMGFIGPEDAITLAGMYAERTAFNTKRWFVKKIYQALELVYNAASLVIDTLRTFILIVLSILGPIVFGLCIVYFACAAAMIAQLFLPEEKHESAVPVSRLVDSPIQRDSLHRHVIEPIKT